MRKFNWYHMHSDYSLLDSCTNFRDYVQLSKDNGANALSISEHGKPLNWTEKWGACKDAGLKYIHSVEIYLTESLENKVRDNYHTVLMARNYDGVRELNKLVTMSCNKDHFYYVNRLSFDEFLSMSDNIISTSACLASPLNKLEESNPYYFKLLKKYDFLEVQPHICEDQFNFNKKLLSYSNEYGIPLIAGTDTHSSSDYKAECRSVLLASKHKSYGDEDLFDLTFRTPDEINEKFLTQGALSQGDIENAMDSTLRLYDMVEDFDLDTSIKYPILYGTREKDSEVFLETIDRKFKDKVDKGIIPAEQVDGFKSAIDEEVRVFQKLHMDGFMLSMSELVSWCKENNIAIGTARGSVGGSRVAYVTDITDLNPERWNTVFSRFANEDREEIGDVDIDCVESDRPAIFEYIVNKFGTDRTARVASFGTIKDKGVIDDTGRYLADKWKKEHEGYDESKNPWSLANIAKIKKEFEQDPDKTKEKYEDLFYYFDGLIGTKVSQSVHPAGMVISPITLPDNFGVFEKDNDLCLMLDMDNVHDYTGLAKYDFLVLKTVQVIRDTCNYLQQSYPKSHEIDWNDQNVWEDMNKNLATIFQFEGAFAADSFKKFHPTSIEDMSLVTAAIRPSGASYRDDLLARKEYKNPSTMIDDLLSDSSGFLVYQEQTIKFLQNICGLTGSEADNIRRAIGRKQKERLDAAMPSILEGYCNKSDKPREEAEEEATAFLQIIEDSASYQFGYNHSISYCMLGYFCGYYRYYYPLEYLTAYLNNAANDDDITIGTLYANKLGITITSPKWGFSIGDYFFDREKNRIVKGMSSIKYMSDKVPKQLYDLSQKKHYDNFIDVLIDMDRYTDIDTRQIDILIKIDFFAEFGNQREILFIKSMFYELFKAGKAKQIRKSSVAGNPIEPIIAKYSVGVTKSGAESANYIIQNMLALLYESEDAIKAVNMEDIDEVDKARNFNEVMGYMGYISGKEEDRPKLIVTKVSPLKRKKDNKQFGYSVFTKSIGSGIEARFTVFNRVYDLLPIKDNDAIQCDSFTRDGQYFTLNKYHMI